MAYLLPCLFSLQRCSGPCSVLDQGLQGLYINSGKFEGKSGSFPRLESLGGMWFFFQVRKFAGKMWCFSQVRKFGGMWFFSWVRKFAGKMCFSQVRTFWGKCGAFPRLVSFGGNVVLFPG